MSDPSKNIDPKVVSGFGDEWSRFDQSELSQVELETIFEQYFAIFPWETLPKDAVGFDLGCGSGRWAKQVAKRVGHLHCIDASADALAVARRSVKASNCSFHEASVDAIPLPAASCDFGYSLGVLHHVPDTVDGLKQSVERLKPGAPFLLYLYYAFDNRPLWFRGLWQCSDWLRKAVSRLPHFARYWVSQFLAALVYWPLARLSQAGERFGANVQNWPLMHYRHRSFYVMRTDALDRFGTRLEQRFTKAEIQAMMRRAGLSRIRFSKSAPYWVAIGFKD